MEPTVANYTKMKKTFIILVVLTLGIYQGFSQQFQTQKINPKTLLGTWQEIPGKKGDIETLGDVLPINCRTIIQIKPQGKLVAKAIDPQQVKLVGDQLQCNGLLTAQGTWKIENNQLQMKYEDGSIGVSQVLFLDQKGLVLKSYSNILKKEMVTGYRRM